MRTARVIGVTAVAVALAGGIASSAQAGNSATTMKLTAVQTEGKLTRPCDTCVLQGNRTSQVGAEYFAAETLKRNGKTVGHDVLYAPLVSSAGLGEFFVTLDLGSGQIAGQGIGNINTGKGLLAITGGTGRYRAASGTIAFQSVSDTTTRITVSLDG
jgi:hypothetical protein